LRLKPCAPPCNYLLAAAVMLEVSVTLFLFVLLAVLFAFFLGAAMHHWYQARKANGGTLGV